VILQFGKYKGLDTSSSRVPASYLRWLERQKRIDLTALRDAMQERGLIDQYEETCSAIENTDLSAEIMEMGYKTLSKKYHPDCGGTTEKMQALNATIENWRRRRA
jgi:hypothetical protein